MNKKSESKLSKKYIFSEDDFFSYVDSSAFIFYIFLTIGSLFSALFINSQFAIYGLIPLSFSDMVGCYPSEKYILYVVDMTYIFYGLLFYKR